MHSFLQSKDWAEFQKTLGRKTWEFHQDGISALIIRHPLPFGKSYLYVPYGPEIDFHGMHQSLKHSIAGFFAYLNHLAYENKSIFVKIEPRSDMTAELLAGKRGFRYSRKTVQPHRTTVVDLRKSEPELLSSFHHKTRYNINLAQKKGIRIEESHQLDTFLSLLKKTTEHDGFVSHPREYYENLLEFFGEGRKRQAVIRLYLAYHGQKAVAGVLMLEYGKTAYYLHGASDREYRALMAPHLLHWELMKKYRNAGFEAYDLWGIDAKKWPGVTRFKLGFSGRTIEYPGAFDMPVSTWWYWGYKLARKLR